MKILKKIIIVLYFLINLFNYSLSNYSYEYNLESFKGHFWGFRGQNTKCQEGYYGDNCGYTRPVVKEFKPADINGGQVEIDGTFIDYLNYKITIGNKTCKVLSSNSTYIICGIEKFDDYDKKIIKIIQNDVVWYEDYTPFPNCKNGVLKHYKCICDFGFIGINCDEIDKIRIEKIEIPPNINGGYIRLKGWFGNSTYQSLLKFIIDQNNLINVTSINTDTVEGFINSGNAGLSKNISIYNNLNNNLIFVGQNMVNFITNPCKINYYKSLEINDRPKISYCLCKVIWYDGIEKENCDRYVQNKINLNNKNNGNNNINNSNVYNNGINKNNSNNNDNDNDNNNSNIHFSNSLKLNSNTTLIVLFLFILNIII